MVKQEPNLDCKNYNSRSLILRAIDLAYVKEKCWLKGY